MILDNQKAAATSPAVLSLQGVVKTLLDDALARAKQKLSVPERNASLEKLLGLSVFQNSFKYGVAQGIARVLSENDKFVRAVYSYEPSMNPDSESGEDLQQSATVHLLIVVSQSSAALGALIGSLDRSLVAALQDLPSSKFQKSAPMLDVNLVTEQEIQQGTGYAVLLSSIFAPPLKLWPRETS